MGNKIKALFKGSFLLAFGAGAACGFGVGLIPRVRTWADAKLNSFDFIANAK